MKKIILIITIALLAAATVSAQSLQDNEYYRKMVELKRQSEAAFEDGDYAEAKRLADEASSYKDLSDQWIETQLAAFRARSALVRLQNRLADLNRPRFRENYPEELAEGKALYDQAYAQYYTDKDYPTSMATSERGLAVLAAIGYPSDGEALPAYYRVRLIPEKRDCLWNIAGYGFVYGDPFSWRLLYDANRDKLPEPANPHLILPDMVLSIPEREGENRSGTWENGVIR